MPVCTHTSVLLIVCVCVCVFGVHICRPPVGIDGAVDLVFPRAPERPAEGACLAGTVRSGEWLDLLSSRFLTASYSNLCGARFGART